MGKSLELVQPQATISPEEAISVFETISLSEPPRYRAHLTPLIACAGAGIGAATSRPRERETGKKYLVGMERLREGVG